MALKQVIINTTTYQLQQTDSGDAVNNGSGAHATKLLSYDHTTGRCLVLVDNKAYETFVHATAHGFLVQLGSKGPLVLVNNQTPAMPKCQLTGAKQSTSTRQQPPSSPNTLTCPLSGKVLAVLCSVGQKVEKGNPLVIVESMKMEHEICAPADAYVKHVSITHGSVVQKGQVLIEFERKGDE